MLSQPSAHLVTACLLCIFTARAIKSEWGHHYINSKGRRTRSCPVSESSIGFVGMMFNIVHTSTCSPRHQNSFFILCQDWWLDGVTLPLGDCDHWDNAGHIRMPSPRSHYMPSPIVTCALASPDTQDTHNVTTHSGHMHACQTNKKKWTRPKVSYRSASQFHNVMLDPLDYGLL